SLCGADVLHLLYGAARRGNRSDDAESAKLMKGNPGGCSTQRASDHRPAGLAPPPSDLEHELERPMDTTLASRPGRTVPDRAQRRPRDVIPAPPPNPRRALREAV